MIRVDQGNEFVSRNMGLWTYRYGVTLDLLRMLLKKLVACRRYCNEERPHGTIGNKVPIMLTKSGGVPSPPP